MHLCLYISRADPLLFFDFYSNYLASLSNLVTVSDSSLTLFSIYISYQFTRACWSVRLGLGTGGAWGSYLIYSFLGAGLGSSFLAAPNNLFMLCKYYKQDLLMFQ